MWPERFGDGTWRDWLGVGLPVITFLGIMFIASIGLDGL